MLFTDLSKGDPDVANTLIEKNAELTIAVVQYHAAIAKIQNDLLKAGISKGDVVKFIEARIPLAEATCRYY